MRSLNAAVLLSLAALAVAPLGAIERGAKSSPGLDDARVARRGPTAESGPGAEGRTDAAEEAPPRGLGDVWGPLFRLPDGPVVRYERRADELRPDAMHALRHWNQIAIDASGLDHTPVAPGEDRVFGEQFGPTRASRAMAIVHIAIFDAVNAIVGKYKSYTAMPTAPPGASLEAAIAVAAHDTLVAMFPSQSERFGAELADALRLIPEGPPRMQGFEAGLRAATAILALREGDGSNHEEPRLGVDYFTSDAPGHWRQDPISQLPLALGAYWGQVEPFVMTSGNQFRVPRPPALSSDEYAAAFEEVVAIGGDGDITPTVRTTEQTQIGIYWAYDGTPSLCAPTRLYNQLTMVIADKMGTRFLDLVRLLALVNVATADAAIASWESKYFYDFWRPVIAIREAEPGTGPTGAGDGNPATVADPTFTPLGAPASNLSGPNFSPPFPAYPSGHATFGGALFQVLRRFYRRDDVAFTFISDEFNGETVDNEGNVRPLLPRSFDSFSEAEEENGQSRIYLGIHWAFDKTEGIAQGRKVGNYVFDHAFTPLRRGIGTPD